MARVKKELAEEEILEDSFEESLQKLELEEEMQPLEEKQELEGKVLLISKGSVFVSYLVDGVECGISIPLNEQNKDVKPGDLIKF